jgi:type IV pilus assembly protein PilW
MVEILVAMVIGMITVLIIMQVMATTEAQRRTVTSGSDSGTAASLAMQELQRDLMNAGFGMTVEASLFTSCGGNAVSAYNQQRLVPDATASTISIPAGGFLPVAINPPGMAAADANTDVIQVMYSGSDFFAGRGIKVKDEGAAGDLRTISEGGVVYTTSALAAGDLALIVKGTSCIIVQVNGVPAVDRITRVAGTWNEGGNLNRGLSFDDPATGGVPGVLYSLGSQERFVMRAFAIRGGRLTVCSPLVQNCGVASQWQPVADGIVSLRAELGVDTTNDDAVDVWTLTAPAAWEDAKAIRLALVARGQHRERDPIGNADCTPSWAGNDNDSPTPDRTCPGTGAALAATDRRIVLNSADTPDAAAWSQYRHRVVQTTIALRNAFWSNN